MDDENDDMGDTLDDSDTGGDSTGITDDSGFQDYLSGDDTGDLDDNAGTNPTNAAASSPVITNSKGASSVTPGSSTTSGFGSSLTTGAQNAFNGLLATATKVGATQLSQPLSSTTTATPSGTPAATLTAAQAASASSTTTYLIFAALAAVVLFLVMRKR